MSMNIRDSLEEAMRVDGAAGVALVDLKSGMALGTAGNSPNLETEAAANMEIIRAKMKVLQSLGRKDTIEDILITLGQKYHLLRVVSHNPNQPMMLYLNLNRNNANLALARIKLAQIEETLEV